MKYNYQVSSLIGASYEKYQICFTRDGENILCPVGNNVSLLRLKKDEIKTFQVHSSYNIEHIALSPKTATMICTNEDGEANIISMINGHKISTSNFQEKINCVSFSPDGKMFAIGRGKLVFLYWFPTLREKNFILYDTYGGPTEDVTSISWTDNSNVFIVGAEDGITRMYAVFGTNELVIYSTDAHLGPIVKTSFMKDSLDALSVGKCAQLCYFKCNEEFDFLSQEEPIEPVKKKSNPNDNCFKAQNHIYLDISTGQPMQIEVTVADFHRGTNLLVTGFIDGRIMIHEMPKFILRFTMRGCQGAISSIALNPDGSCIAMASSINNELNVLNWSSRSFIYQSNGHKYSSIIALDYSPDGNNLVTGGHDGVVKLWQILSGRCMATFPLHAGPVTGVAFPRKKTKLFFSSSLDGTVRCYELSTLNFFCVLTVEQKSYQFSCVSSDDNGDLVAAGCGADCFSVLVWSVKTKKLIYTLSGHQQPVSSVMFSSVAGGNCLVSGSWDSTIRIWRLLAGPSKKVNNKSAVLAVANTSDVLAVAFRPDGLEIAGALLTGVLVFFNALTGEQTHKIDGKKDLGISKDEGELVTAKKASEEKMFQTICYSSCGRLLLAGGNSKFLCLYHIEFEVMIRRFEISCNLSLKGVLEVHDHRRITNWGLSDNTMQQIGLDTIISSIKFSPVGTNFSAATAEGVLLFSARTYISDYVDFQENISDVAVKPLSKKQLDNFINNILDENNFYVLAKTIELVPPLQVVVIIKQLIIIKVRKVLCRFVEYQLRNSVNIDIYAYWAKIIIDEWIELASDLFHYGWKKAMVDLMRIVKLTENKSNVGVEARYIDAYILILDGQIAKRPQENINN